MRIVVTVASLALIGVTLWDAFEAMILPRRVTRPFRLARLYYYHSWLRWRALAQWIRSPRRRETFLSIFGPLSLFGLFGLWMSGLIAGFGLLYWSLETPLQVPGRIDEAPGVGTYVYLSGTTFFTLGYGDVTSAGALGRALTVCEAGLGFGFLACIIAYVPVLYQAFSAREVMISLLDARAGSPPSAAQALVRAAQSKALTAVPSFLAEWERWAAELLESHLSYPVLAYYRSQHDNQSWLAALTSVMDTCTLLLTGLKEVEPFQAQLTFAMSRHAVVDLSMIFRVPPQPPEPDRLPPEQLQHLRRSLNDVGLVLREGPAIDAKLAELRGMYEPFVNALAQHFLLALPPIVPDHATVDNWQTSAWMRRTPGFGTLPAPVSGDEHFD
jgi:hypothetical protein